jgi:hypothetical protein
MKFTISRFDYVDDVGHLHLNFDLNGGILDVNDGCGIYTLLRVN